MWRGFLLVAVTAGMTALSAGAAPADGLEGVWLTKGGESRIEIAPCGDALCGRILPDLKPAAAQNAQTKDVNNPDPALRDRPIEGIAILSNLKPGDEANVWQGSVYNPDDGGTYDVTVTLKGDKLKVEGCMAYILCDSQTWTRVQTSQPGLPQSLLPQVLTPQ